MRAVVMGAVEGTRVALRSIAMSPGWSLAGVVTLPPQLSNRHSDFVDIGAAAAEFGSEIIQAADGNDPAVVKRVSVAIARCAFVIGWSPICRQPMLETGRLGTIAYHPAPLPRLRGRAPIPWTILLATDHRWDLVSGSTKVRIRSDPSPAFLSRGPDETADYAMAVTCAH